MGRIHVLDLLSFCLLLLFKVGAVEHGEAAAMDITSGEF